MKTQSFNILAKNAKNQSVNLTIEVTHFMAGVSHQFSAKIIDSSLPVVVGESPNGFYGGLVAVHNVTVTDAQSFTFGLGEIKRQRSYPFVVYLSDSQKNKNDRMFFCFPHTEAEFKKLFVETIKFDSNKVITIINKDKGCSFSLSVAQILDKKAPNFCVKKSLSNNSRMNLMYNGSALFCISEKSEVEIYSNIYDKLFKFAETSNAII